MYAITIVKTKKFDKQARKLIEVSECLYLDTRTASAPQALQLARMNGMLGDIQLVNTLPEGAIPFQCGKEVSSSRPVLPYTSHTLYAR